MKFEKFDFDSSNWYFQKREKAVNAIKNYFVKRADFYKALFIKYAKIWYILVLIVFVLMGFMKSRLFITLFIIGFCGFGYLYLYFTRKKPLKRKEPSKDE